MPESSIPKFILASASPRRAQLLGEAGLVFQQIASTVDEQSIDVLEHGQFARVAALMKARDVASRAPAGMLVLGADTIVCLDKERLGKPNDEADARRMLLALQDRWHEVITGVAVCRAGEESCPSDFVETDVWFGSIPIDELEAYLHTAEPYDKAGAYGIQGWAGQYITRIEGDYNNVVGLPVDKVIEMLRASM